MVRSHWLGITLLALSLTNVASGQHQATAGNDARQNTTPIHIGTKPSSVAQYQGWKGSSNSSTKKETEQSSEKFITVEEPGKEAQKCKVLAEWKTKSGSIAYRIKNMVTGEIATISNDPVATPEPTVVAKPAPVSTTELLPKIRQRMPTVQSLPVIVQERQPVRTTTKPITSSTKQQWPSAHSNGPKSTYRPYVQPKPTVVVKPKQHVVTKPKAHVVTKPTVPVVMPKKHVVSTPSLPMVNPSPYGGTTAPLPVVQQPIVSTSVPCQECTTTYPTTVHYPKAKRPSLLQRIFGRKPKPKAIREHVIIQSAPTSHTVAKPGYGKVTQPKPTDWRQSWGKVAAPVAEPLVERTKKPSRGTLLMKQFKAEEEARNRVEAEYQADLARRAAIARKEMEKRQEMLSDQVAADAARRAELAQKANASRKQVWNASKPVVKQDSSKASVQTKTTTPVKKVKRSLWDRITGRNKTSQIRTTALPPPPAALAGKSVGLPRAKKLKVDPLGESASTKNTALLSETKKETVKVEKPKTPVVPVINKVNSVIPPPPMPGAELSGGTEKEKSVKPAVNSKVEKKSTPALPETVQAYKPNGKVPLGSGSVIQAGQTSYVPVPIVTMPNLAKRPTPPPQAPQLNQAVNMRYAYSQGRTPSDTVFAPNAFTTPGVKRPIPAETQVGNLQTNAFGPENQVMWTGNGPAALGGGQYPNAYQYGYPMNSHVHHVTGYAGRIPPHATVAGGRPPMPPASPMGQPNPYGMAARYSMPQYGYRYGRGVVPQAPVQRTSSTVSMPTSSKVDFPTIGSVQKKSELLAMLRNASYPSHREWAADQLSQVSPREHPDVVQNLMSVARTDSSGTVRSGCARALAKMGVRSQELLNLVLELKKDDDPRVKEAASLMLSAMGVKDESPAIQPVSGQQK